MSNTGFNQVFDSFRTMGFGSGFSYSAEQVIYQAGIKADRYTQGYFADDMSWFNSRTPTSTTYPTDKILDPSSGDGDSFSRRWTGYFRAPTTETYTFYTESDDSSWMWLGDSAKAGWSSVNALVNNGGAHGAVERSGTVSLIEGVLYPIQVFFGDAGGGDILYFNYSTPAITKTDDLTGLIYYNSAAIDGRGF